MKTLALVHLQLTLSTSGVLVWLFVVVLSIGLVSIDPPLSDFQIQLLTCVLPKLLCHILAVVQYMSGAWLE